MKAGSSDGDDNGAHGGDGARVSGPMGHHNKAEDWTISPYLLLVWV